MRLRRSTVLGALILLLLFSAGTLLVANRMWKGFKRAPATQETTAPRRGAPRPSFLDRFPTEYHVTERAEAQPETPPPPPPGSTPPPGGILQPGSTGTAAATRPPTRPPPEPPKPPATPQVVSQAPAPAQTQRGPATSPPAASPKAAGTQDEGPRRWFTPKTTQRQGKLLLPPIPEDKDEKTQSQLFPKAVHERPENPYRILYADQIVPVLLAQNISTDAPGTLRLKTPEDVTDRWGHGHVIIPADTTFMAVQQGKADYGQTRIPLQVYMAIFPDSSAAYWEGGQVGDAMGANGLPAQVDNHYVKLLLGVGLQALLNIGGRAPFGSTSGFQQNLPQEFAQDATQGVNQAGSRIIQRQFQVPPTLSQEFGYPATISFMKNVSFQTDAVVVTK